MTESLFELAVCLLLNGLGVLKFLDQLHLKQLHLHDFLFLHLSNARLLFQLAIEIALHGTDPSLLVLFDLQLRESLLLYDQLVLKLRILLRLKLHLHTPLGQLGFDSLGLLGFLPLRQVNGLLDLALLILTLFLQDVVILAAHLLRFDIDLEVDDLLLHLLLVAALELLDLAGALLGLLDLLPRLHLLLLQQGDAVRKQLRITLDPKYRQMISNAFIVI